VRVLVSAALLTLLLVLCKPATVWQYARAACLPLLAGALAVYLSSMLLVAWRWQLLLRADGVSVPLLRLTRYYLIGFFLNNFLPSSIGGDVARVLYAARQTGSVTHSFSVVFIERLLGFLAMAALALLGMLALLTTLDARAAWWLGGVTGALTLAFAAVAVVSFSAQAQTWIAARCARSRWQTLAARIAEASAAIHHFRARPATLLAVFAISIAYQIVLGCFTYMVTRATGLATPFWLVFALMQLSSMAGIIPITLETAGMREGIYVLALQPLGYDRSLVLTALLLVRFLSVLGSAVGGLIWMTEPRVAPCPARTMDSITTVGEARQCHGT
jgi:uncharacterized protein (TIRG00374 family)